MLAIKKVKVQNGLSQEEITLGGKVSGRLREREV